MSPQPGKLLRVFVNEHDRRGGKPLYEAIVDRCREMHVAGATVFRALEGYGETAELHRAQTFGGDQPAVITIVERPEKVRELLPVLQDMLGSGLIAVTDVEVTAVSHGARVPLT